MKIPNLIIGGGIAGLLIAYRLEQLGLNFILVEKRDYLGGRIKSKYFHGKKMPLGAGIMRETDNSCISLCKEMGITYSTFQSTYICHPSLHYDQKTIDMLVALIKSTYEIYKPHIDKNPMNFKTFIQLYLPVHLSRIEECLAYTDCWKTDIKCLIYDYPLKELFPSTHMACSIDGSWNNVIEHIINKITNKLNLHTSEKVLAINSDKKTVTTDRETYSYNKLFICTDMSIFDKKNILPPLINDYLGNISSVPYIRLYTYHPFGHNIPHFYYVPGPISKSIPMSDKILMASYSDNHNAQHIKQLSLAANSTDTLNKLLQSTQTGGEYHSDYFTDYMYKYWKHGVHYYKPHIKTNNNDSNFLFVDDVYVIGEMVSHSQGWVEGAVVSARDAITHFKEKLIL